MFNIWGFVGDKICEVINSWFCFKEVLRLVFIKVKEFNIIVKI